MKKHLAFFLCIGLLLSASAIFAQPANDNCSTAVGLTVAADEASATAVAGTTTGGTASTTPTSVCSGSWFQDDVWYSFTTGATAPANGVTIKVAPGTMSLLGIAVYTGCGATEVPLQCVSTCDGDDFMSIPFAQPNTTYYVRMWSGCSPTANSGTFDIIVFENYVDPNAAVDLVLWGAVSGEGDFAGGLNGWTSNAISTGDDWIWEADAAANGAFRTTAITSPTASNGAMLFDADFMTTSVNPNPAAPYPQHSAELISPVIDCSNMPELSVKFYQSYDALNGDCFFSYSIDGGNTFTTPISINSDIAGNGATPTPSIKRYFLTGASGSNQVQLKFTADMDFYNWILDDVQLIKKEGNNLVLANDFIARAPIYTMPQSSIDTIRFLADVANVGANDQSNVMLSVDVVRNSDNVSVFSATNSYGMMMAGDTIENKAFSLVYFPDTALASYTVTYTLSSDSTDVLPNDNTFSYEFEVVANFHDKTPGYTRNITPSGDNAWTYGTSYYVANGTDVTTEYPVTAVSFGASNPAELANESVTIFIEKPITGTVLDADGSGAIELSEREIVAFGTYTFTGNETPNAVLNVAIEDFNTGNPYLLESNTNYSVVINFVPSNTTVQFRMLAAQSAALNYQAADFAAGLNGVERYAEILDVGNSGNYGLAGFVGNPVPFVRLNFAQNLVSTNNLKLADNALTVFPNPADEFITATIELEKMAENARIAIYNVSGQIIETRNLSNVQNERILFDLNSYSSGTYFISVATESGSTIKRFIVSK
jgi:hypothetical protein